jgi:predicted nicotinamide N-methyase
MPSIAERPIPGGWTEREIPVGLHVFRLLTPADPDALLSHLVEQGDAAQPHLADPYWSKLWPAAGFLAQAVSKSRIQSPKSCLELGCGSGLVGLAALAAGFDVTFSDYVPLAVELALENAARNGFERARGLVLDWRQPPAQTYPFILAADVTYDRANIRPLLGTLERMLAPGGQVWLGDAGRGPAAEFLTQAQDRGWSVQLFDEHDRPALVPALGRCQRIVLRKSAQGSRFQDQA